jgi:3-oxoacyl-[acyl-carrier-protein] synthase II
MSANQVVITGIGLLSSLGEGPEAHWQALTAGAFPVLENDKFAPYAVHPLPVVDWSLQIQRRSDQRQMETWQRIGTYTAGLALADAGMKEDAGLVSTMDLIVAAAGGERDISVDNQIMQAARARNDRDAMLNEKLTTELRPTLFLAQLSNLLAGNISIVHNVTGSSRTFMGEEGAGIAAIKTAHARISAGQSTHVLVGGALNTEYEDALLSYELGGFLQRDGWSPVWQRDGRAGGGVITGSGSAFLVLEARGHAEARGARIYARLDAVDGDQVRRKDDNLQKSLSGMMDAADPNSSAQIAFSAASGAHLAMHAERKALTKRPDLAVRAFATATGHLKEAQMPFALALAAMSVHKGEALAPLDKESGMEKEVRGPLHRALVLTAGFHRSEGAALVSKA